MIPGLSAAALTTAFAGGVVSFLSPCVLPLVPGYLSYIAGQSAGAGAAPRAGVPIASLRLSLCFVLGFSTVFILLGASATELGQFLLSWRYQANLVGGAAIIVFGLLMTGLVPLPWLQREARFHLDLPGGRALAAYVLGLAFAFGWTPCIGPVLGTILTASAAVSTVRQGVALLAVYSLGLGVPFLAAALFTGSLLRRLRQLSRLGRLLQIGTGAVVIAMGLAMLTGELSAVSYWLLDTFPVFARIG